MRLLAFICILFLASPAAAQFPPIQDVPPGQDVIVPLRKGDSAPFTGQLFDSDTALRWGHWLEQYQYRLQHDVETQKQIDLIRMQYLAQVIQIEEDKHKLVVKDYQDRLKAAQEEATNPPWYRTVEFGIVIGAVATIACVAAGVGIVYAATPH